MPLGIIQQWRDFCEYAEGAGSPVNSLFYRTPFLPPPPPDPSTQFFCGTHTSLEIEWSKIYEGMVTRNWPSDVTALWAAARVPLPQGESYRHGHHDRRFSECTPTPQCDAGLSLCVRIWSVRAEATELYSEGTRFEAWLRNHQSDAYFSCKLNTFRQRVKNVVTSKGTEMGIWCK
jgi:hypothetical protein